MEQRNMTHHVVIFPMALQGPMNSTFKLAELLCLSGLNITFLVAKHIYTRLLQSTDIQTAMNRYKGFQIRSVPDGLTADQLSPGLDNFFKVLDILKSNLELSFRDMMSSGTLCSETHGPVSCIIADGYWGFPCDVAREIGIPVFAVRTISPCSLWAFMRLPELIEAGELPFQGDDLDVMIRSIDGTEGFLRRRDLPSFYRLPDLEDPIYRLCGTERRENPRFDGLILNSFEEIEESILPHMRTICPNIYTLGPLHAHFNNKLDGLTPASTTSLWKEDRSCLEWLDQQPSNSVLYVSFGSIATLTKDNLLELWHGLVDSGVRFLWVRRPDSVVGEDSENDIPKEVLKGTKERGYIVKWAPQEEVLGHKAVGGFLTHSGWNSTLESMCSGVPMICWPFLGDQQINSRFVSELWGLGLDMKDTCDRSMVEKMVRELMETRKEEFAERAAAMVESIDKCLTEGGSSYRNLERLIKDIDTMSPTDI